jgi:putative transposase
MSQQDNQPRERERTPNNRTTTGFRISDQRWAVLQPLLPVHGTTQRLGGGRPRVADRAGADARFCVLRTGCQGQALHQTEWCAHATAPDRFHAWVEAGVFRTLWHAGVQQFADLSGIAWDGRSREGALTKAPLGGGTNRAQSHRPGQVRRPAQRADGGTGGAPGAGSCRRPSA